MATEWAFSEKGSVLSAGRLSDVRWWVTASGEGVAVGPTGPEGSRCIGSGDRETSRPPSTCGPAPRSTSGSRVRMMSSSHRIRARAALAKLERSG